MSANQSMRSALSIALGRLALSNPRLMAVSADGQLIFQDFMRNAPGRHVDVGISEATLVGVAAGMARCGGPVVVSAIASFLLRRAYEQILVDVGFDHLSVTMIGIGGGLAYGAMGATHHIPEDVALMRRIPGMSVFTPADAAGAVSALGLAAELGGPCYLRIGSGEDAVLPAGSGQVGLTPRVLRDGDDITLLASGVCVHEALAAAVLLAKQGFEARVVEVMCLQPWPAETVAALVLAGRPLITVEEHLRDGGLGSLVMETLPSASLRGFHRLAIDHRHAPVATRSELLAFYGIDRSAIVRAARHLLSEPISTLMLEGEP